MNRTSVWYHMKDRSEEREMSYVRDAEERITNQLRLATEGHRKILPTMLYQIDAVDCSRKLTVYIMRSTYPLSMYKFLKTDTLRSVNNSIF